MLAQQTFERPQHAGIVVDDINQLLSRQALSCSARRRTVLRVDVGRYTPETPRSVPPNSAGTFSAFAMREATDFQLSSGTIGNDQSRADAGRFGVEPTKPSLSATETSSAKVCTFIFSMA